MYKGYMDKEVHWVTGAKKFILGVLWGTSFPQKQNLSLLKNYKYSTPFNIVHHRFYELCCSCLIWLYQTIHAKQSTLFVFDY